MTTQINTYGKCPQCGGEGLTRERRPNGNDKCVNGHTYPSAKALSQPNEPVAWVCGGELYLSLEEANESKRDWSLIPKPLYTSPPNTSELEDKVKELENEVADLNRISDIRKRKAVEKTERIAELEIRNTDLVAGVKNWQEIASKSDARNAKLEVSLDKSRKNYIKACKGRMDFRNSFREGKAKIAELEQANKVLEAKCKELEENNITQLAAISTAAIGYFKDGDSILPEYDTVALRDVTSLYATYADIAAKLEKMREAICIYSREMLGDINFESDEQAINYMLSFTEENPHGEALEECK